jgi:hypothetical protein
MTHAQREEMTSTTSLGFAATQFWNATTLAAANMRAYVIGWDDAKKKAWIAPNPASAPNAIQAWSATFAGPDGDCVQIAKGAPLHLQCTGGDTLGSAPLDTSAKMLLLTFKGIGDHATAAVVIRRADNQVDLKNMLPTRATWARESKSSGSVHSGIAVYSSNFASTIGGSAHPEANARWDLKVVYEIGNLEQIKERYPELKGLKIPYNF